MSWAPTTKLRICVVLVAVGLVAGLVAGRPEPVVFAVPFAIAMAVGLAAAGPADVRVRARLAEPRVTEGSRTTLVLELLSAGTLPLVELFVELPAGLACAPDEQLRGLELVAGAARTIEVAIDCERWGAYRLGAVRLRVRSAFGLLEAEAELPASQLLSVYPRPETLRRVVRSRDTQSAAGNRLASVRAPGIDFADVRPFVAGDRARDVNWRATAKRGVLWVNDRNPDRSTDVVLFLDAFGPRTLSAAVRATHTLATAYLTGRDRVGLVVFGGTVAWVRPGMGQRQQYVLVDALLSTQVFENSAWKDLTVLPRRVLPPKALVVAVSPLEDERMLKALVDLRARGIDVVIVEVSPVALTEAGPGRIGAESHRLWLMSRDVRRDRYREMGVPVVAWTEDRPLGAVIEEIRAWPRHAAR